MKKQFFLLPILGAIMASCSSDNLTTDNDVFPENYVNSYLSVSVIGANATGMRADSEYEMGDGTYQDGTEDENYVDNVRFFFFYEDGTAAMVRKEPDGKYYSYMDISKPEVGDNNHNETIEKIVETTLRLNIPEGYRNPNMVLTVINPTPNIKALPNPTLADLKEQIRNYKMEGTTELTKKNFVMSNSVYANSSQEVFDAQILTPDNFQTSDDAAKNHPVNIYVERVLARVDFSLENLGNEKITLNDGTVIYKLKVPDGSATDQYYVNGDETTVSKYEDIYVKFLGWNVTSTPKKSRLIKEINGAWTNQSLFGTGTPFLWTTTDYHRSFWALNPDLTSDSNYDFISFDKALTSPQTLYLQENANKYSANKTAAAPDSATKVFIAAQLVDENGEALNLVKWLNGFYTVDGAKNTMANTLDIYKEDGATGYKKIEPSDLKFDHAKDASHGYYATAVVTDNTKTWYEKTIDNETGDTKYQKIENVNSYIYTKLGYALLWETGKTYYFFDIRHLGEEGSVAYNGIVRNHIYKTSITSIAGLGTPVYEPDEDIYPEIPEKESIISAKVNILSWRIVTHTYDLVW